jgi:hypothetical protein
MTVSELINEATSFLARNGAVLDTATRDLIRKLRDKLEKLDQSAFARRQVQHQTELREWLNPNSKNFMGTGLTLEEYLMHGHIKRWRASWAEQGRKEQRRRREYVVALSVLYEQISGRSLFGTASITEAIDGIIEGDLDRLRDARAFANEDEANYAPAVQKHWARVYELIEAAIASWPKDDGNELEASN